MQYVDGTRCTVTPTHSLNGCTVFIESPGYANVTTDVTNCTTSVALCKDILVNCKTDGSYSIAASESRHIRIETGGRVLYSKEDKQYLLNHNGENEILNVEGSESLSVDRLGKVLSCRSNKITRMADSAAFKPRYFTVDEDGQCAELITVESLNRAKFQAGIGTIVQKEKIALSTTITMMELHKVSVYKPWPIIPASIVLNIPCEGKVMKSEKPRLGTDMGSGLHILFQTSDCCTKQDSTSTNVRSVRPHFIEYRQYLCDQSVDTKIKKKLIDSLMKISQYEEKLTDRRRCGTTKASKDSAELMTLYNQACLQQTVFAPPFSRKLLPDVRRRAIKDVTCEKDLKILLREQKIPVYAGANSISVSRKDNPAAKIQPEKLDTLISHHRPQEIHLCRKVEKKVLKVICGIQYVCNIQCSKCMSKQPSI